MNKNLIRNTAKFYLRYNRGSNLTNFIITALKNIVYLGGMGYLLNEWFGITLDKSLILGLTIAYIIGCYIIGLLDEKFGFWKVENHYSFNELNPFFSELMEKVDKIEKNGATKTNT